MKSLLSSHKITYLITRPIIRFTGLDGDIYYNIDYCKLFNEDAVTAYANLHRHDEVIAAVRKVLNLKAGS
jgi:hypothetical protein